MTTALLALLSLREENTTVTGTISAIADAVYLQRNGLAAGNVALEPADITLLKAYPLLPKSTTHIPLEWFIAALSQPGPGAQYHSR